MNDKIKKIICAPLMIAILLVNFSCLSITAFGEFSYDEENNVLYYKNVTDINNAQQYDNISILYIVDSEIDSMKAIKNLNIECLYIENTIIKDKVITIPHGLKSIDWRRSQGTEYTFDGTAAMEEISILDCTFQCVDSFAGFADSLEKIKILESNLCSLKGIERFKNLKDFFVLNSGIESIHELSGLDNLERVTLFNTYVTNLSPLKNKSIHFLDISSSSLINSLNVISTLPDLETICVNNNESAFTDGVVSYIAEHGIKVVHDIGDDSYEDIDNYASYDDINKGVSEIFKNIIDENMNETEKIEAVVKYTANHIEYDYDGLLNNELADIYNDESLYYALKGKGVCRNYSDLTTALLNKAGIKTYTVISNEDQHHCWNLVALEDNLYWIDVTWLKDIISADDKMIGLNWYMAPYDDEEFLSDHHLGDSLPSSLYCKINGLDYNVIEDEELPEIKIQSSVSIPANQSFVSKRCIVFAVIICVTVIVLLAVIMNRIKVIQKTEKLSVEQKSGRRKYKK